MRISEERSWQGKPGRSMSEGSTWEIGAGLRIPTVGEILRTLAQPQIRAACLLAVLVIHTSFMTTTEAFSVQNVMQEPDSLDTGDGSIDHVDEYINVMKRYLRPYRRWGHRSRFAWRTLPNTMCYREPCKYDKHCCHRWNLCDKSAKVCTDCWYGSNCKSEQDCCMKYPYCARTWRRDPNNGRRYIAGGKCVKRL